MNDQALRELLHQTEISIKREKARIALAVFGMAVGLVGYGILIFLVDWKIAIAVFAIHFSINIDHRSKEES